MITLRKLNMSSPEKGTTFEKKITKQIEVIMLQISIIEVVKCSQHVLYVCMDFSSYRTWTSYKVLFPKPFSTLKIVFKFY